MKKPLTTTLVLNLFSILFITNYCFSLSSINANYNLIDGKIAFSEHYAKLPVSEKVKRQLINLSPLNPESNSLQNDFVIRRKVDFDNHAIGLYTNNQFRSDWKCCNLDQPNTTRIQSIDGKKVLANYYPKGTWGNGGGLNQFVHLRDSPDDIEEIYLTYNIKFEKGFDWGLVGKLPGFSFGNVQTVAAGGDGPNIGNKGSSLRLIWGKNGEIEFYVYHHRMNEKYGDDMGVGSFGQFVKDKWHELTLRVVGNDIGKANGVMQVWLDGTLLATATNIEMRTSSSPKTIREFILGTFMGGSDSRFAPKINQFMWMDDIHVWHYSKEFLNANPSVARGRKPHSNSHELYTPISGSVAEKTNRAPTVGITSPKANYQFLKGDNISITADAADSDGTISKVDFYNGSNLLGTDTTSPYSFAWANLPVGSFALTAKATDNKGTATISTVVNINVVDKANVAPTVSITAPVSNAKFIQGDNMSITANATNIGGTTITKVDFYNGSTLLGTDTTSPYSFAWANLPVGNFALTAKATDNKGTASVSAVVNINVGEKTSRSPYGGTAAIIPGTVEAENYDIGGQGVTYHDVDAGNNGGVYRADDVDIEPAAEGGYNVGWMNLNEWLEYTVNITTAGAYNLDARVASPAPGGTFHIECDGVDVTGPLTVPATGGYNTWTSVKKTGVNLPGGMHVLRFVFESYGANGYLGNFNSMHFTKSNATPTVSITSPRANAEFIQGNNISITANATNTGGTTITKVDFYNGSTLLGTDTTSPYSFAWGNLPVGNFALTAKATDNKGTATVSEVINISVFEKTIVASGQEMGTGLLEGMVAFYEMNTNVSGSLMDSHGQNHGTNKLINQTDGFNEKGNLYDGKFSISSVPHSNGLNLTTEFTLMADVFRNGNGQNGTSIIVGKNNNNRFNQDYSLGITPQNKIRIRANLPNLTDWISEVKVPSGKWVRIIATYKSGKGYQIFMDENESEKSPLFSGRITNSNKPLYIGSNSDEGNGAAANDRRLEGKLDNVGIWNRELLPEEIDLLMTEKISYADFGKQGSESYRTIPSEILENNMIGKNDLEEGLIDRQNVQLEYVIGPNPTTDQLNVMFTNLDGDYEFEIRTIAMNGVVQEEYHATPQDSNITIDVADLKPGVYIFQLNYKGKMISSRKFIKQ